MKLLAKFTLFFSLAATALAAPGKPNIIFLLTDDMGYGDVASYRNAYQTDTNAARELVPTPNMDQLAKDGLKFTQFYCPAPVCSPSRAGFLTGMYPGRWRIANYLQTRAGNRASDQADFLDPKAPSIARTMKEAGYATGHFGKWHMGGGRDVTNAPNFPAYGFDEHASTWESPDPDPMITGGNWIWGPKDPVKRWDRSGYFVDKTLDFLKRHKGQPCFVNLWPDDVHTPWVPAGSDLTRRRQEKDDSEPNFNLVLTEYDKQVGRLVQGLKDLGIADNTILVFSSDNGPLPTFRQIRSAGLRGSKDSLYEAGMAEPLIVVWPGHVPAGKVDSTTVIHGVDLFQIFCDLGGATPPKNVAFDGEDLTKAFLGTPMTRVKPLFWEYGRTDNPAYGHPRGRNRSPNLAMRDGKWKLIVNDNGEGAQLYDLETDRRETRDVSAENPEVTKRMTEATLQWRHSLP